MPSIDELNAGFDKAVSSLTNLIDHLAPNHDIPFFGNPHAKALEYLHSDQGRLVVLDEVKQVLLAAEAVRAKAAKA